MKIMDTKVFREIKNQKFRSLLIIGIVATSLSLIISLRAGYPMMIATYEGNLIEQNTADGRFTFPITSPIQSNNITDIQTNSSFMESSNIDLIEGRIILDSIELIYNDIPFEAIVIGVNFLGVNSPNQLNKLNIKENADDINIDQNFLQNNPYCILESKFAGTFLGQGLSINENVSLKINNTDFDFTVKAIGDDIDHLYVVNPTSQMTAMGQMAIVWVDIGFLQDTLWMGAPLINQILFTVDERLDKPMIFETKNQIKTHLDLKNVNINAANFVVFDETDDRRFFDADAGSMDKLGTIFGIIGLIICSVAIYNTLSRIVQAQRRNIGLFMSLGAKRGEIVGHYVKITLFLSGIGIIVGCPIGYLMSIGMTNMILRMFGLVYAVYPIAWGEYIIGALATLIVCTLFSIFSALPITKITPRQAMSAFFNRIKVVKSGKGESIFGKLPMFRPIHMKIPLREIFLRKKKSSITILAISTSMIILISSVAMVGNMLTGINANYEKYNTSDIQINIEETDISNINQFIQDHSDMIDNFETTITIPSNFKFNNQIMSDLVIQCYQENSTFRNFNIIEGEIKEIQDITPEQMLLGNGIAGENNIKVGDKITIGNLDNYTIEIGGLVGELIDFSGFWTIEAFYSNNFSLDYFGIPEGIVNGILLDIAEGVDKAELNSLRNEFNTEFGIRQWTNSEEAQEAVSRFMESFMGILMLFIVLGMAIGILFSFSTMYMGFLSREKDFLAFKAMGTENKYMKKMIFNENALLSLFSLVVTVPIGYLFYAWSMDYMLGDRMYMPISIPWYTWPLIFILNLAAIKLATRKLMKKINKMVLVDELRNRAVS